MRNFKAVGETLQLIAPTGGVTAGVPVIVGSTFAIPIGSADAGDTFVGYVRGVFTLAKADGYAPAAGANAYWNATSLTLTNTTTDELIGVYYEAAASDDTTAPVRLNGIATGAYSAAAASGGKKCITTGYITCTGKNNVSSVPATFRYIVGELESGVSISQVALYGSEADLEAEDMSGATYSVAYGIDGQEPVTLAEFVAPDDTVNIDTLSPAVTLTDTAFVFVDVSGLAAASTVQFKVDITFE